MDGSVTAVEVTIAISTFRRPQGLRRLLESLKVLVAATPTFEIVVVDNDRAGTARPVVDALRSNGFDIRYVVEPTQSISRARNRSVREASGRFVAFIDDDEWADPDWLAELWRAAQLTGADAVFGPVVAVLPPTTPGWIAAAGFLQPEKLDAGTQLAWHQTSTANALVRRDALLDLPELFADSFGLTGGEDSDLFCRMLERGRALVAAGSGTVYTDLPASRASARGLLKRHFRNGVVRARIDGPRAPTSRRVADTAGASLKFLTSGARGLLWLPRDRARGFAYLLRSALAAGRVAGAAGLRYQPYRRRDPTRD
jgi:succinoglycan biosynthesis protein ExoM